MMATKAVTRTAKASATTSAAPTSIAIDPFVELGRTGLRQYSGYIYDEILAELRDPIRRVKLYREIRDNSAPIGAAFRAIDNILRDVKITVVAGGDAPQDLRCWELIDSAFGDLNVPWSSVVSQAGSMKAYGWAALEPVYKQRNGDRPAALGTADGRTLAAAHSKYADGLIGWRKFAPRSQESLLHWDFAPGTDDVIALTQRPAPTFQSITIPIDKLLLFTLDDDKGSPEGRSLLRNCVLSWKFAKRIMEIEGIGVERDLAGLPVCYAPADVLSTTATGNELAVKNYLKKLVTNIRRDAQEGVLLPASTDVNGKRLYELTLLTTGGTRQFDTNKIIERYEHRILMNFLADFLNLGLRSVGSYALSRD
ncbi:MAG: phage portal protein family protein, partial [Steroidobacteraceae bacterium]